MTAINELFPLYRKPFRHVKINPEAIGRSAWIWCPGVGCGNRYCVPGFLGPLHNDKGQIIGFGVTLAESLDVIQNGLPDIRC